MQTSTEHSLGLITKKTQVLEEQLSQQIEHVRRLQQEKEISLSEVTELRSRLDAAERRATNISLDFDDATASLKSLTSEYSKAQLLQKRYRNAVAEQAGFCKAYVCIKGDDGNNGRVSIPGTFVLADECTINLPSRKWQRSVVVDGALASQLLQQQQQQVGGGDFHQHSASEQLLPMTIESTLGDVIAGFNASVVCFGPYGQLKSSLMFGNVNNNNNNIGLVQKSIRRLFNSLEEHRVTHFSMRMSMGEITAPDDQFKDLLSEYSNVLSIGRSPDVRCIPVQSEKEALGLIQLGLQRSNNGGVNSNNGNNNNSQGRRQQQQQSGNNRYDDETYHHPSHKFVVLTIENFDTRGHFRKGTLLFVDLAAPPILFSSSLSQQKLQQQLSNEQFWAQQSSMKFCEAVSYLSNFQQQQQAAASNNNNNQLMSINNVFQQLSKNSNGQHQQNNNNPLDNPTGLLLLLSESLGGNSKTSLITCFDGSNIVGGNSDAQNDDNNNNNSGYSSLDASDNVVGTLNTALMIKSVRNSAMAFDVPSELQKLSMETETFAGSSN